MQERCLRGAGSFGWIAVLFLFAGCSNPDLPAGENPRNNAEAASSAFDAKTTGTVQGRVVWQGQVPDVKPFAVRANTSFHPPWPKHQPPKTFPNPNAPAIDAQGGVGNAVVFLRQVNPQSARPWNHKPVTVVVQDYQLSVEQEAKFAATGFVRCGDKVSFVSKEDRFHAVCARQAAFFSLTLPRAEQPRTRSLTAKGLVELTDAADYYWLRAYLFVDDHPYYAHTDSQGNFCLDQVPAGEYELVAWMPNWLEAGHERDPDTANFSRWFFRPPVEHVQKVHVVQSQITQSEFNFRIEQFAK